MDDILKGLFKSDHSDKIKRTVFKNLRTSNSIASTTSVKQRNILHVTFSYVIHGNEFEHKQALVLLQSFVPHCDAALDQLIRTQDIENILNGIWKKDDYEVICEFVIARTLFERLVVVSTLLDKASPDFQTHKRICLVVKSEAIRIMHTSYDHRSFSEICRLLIRYEGCMPPLSHGYPMCSLSIHAMSDFGLVDDSMKDISLYVNDVGDVVRVLQHVWTHAPTTLLPSLREIFKIISSTEKEPSNALGCLVALIPEPLINDIIRGLVRDQSVTEQALRCALERMMAWLAWPTAVRTHLWILAFFKELEKLEKYSLLIEVSLKTVKQVFACVQMTSVRNSALAVLLHMLMSYRHSPDSFHLIVPHIPQMVEKMETEGDVVHVRQLVNLCYCMMQLHSGFPELYCPLLEAFKSYPKPSWKEVEVCALQHTSWSSSHQRPDLLHAELAQRSRDTQAGLRNLGNTCYMNSVLQALFMIHEFRSYVMSRGRDFARSSVTRILERTFAYLQLTHRRAYSPTELVQHSRPSWFAPGAQQDCSEYLKHVLDVLHDEALCRRQSATNGEVADDTCATTHDVTSSTTQPKPAETQVEGLFHGEMSSEIRCRECGARSCRREKFVDLALPLTSVGDSPFTHAGASPFMDDGTSPPPDDGTSPPTDPEHNSSTVAAVSTATNAKRDDDQPLTIPVQVSERDDVTPAAMTSSRRHDMHDLLRGYFAPEEMVGENKFHCGNCQQLTEAVKRVSLVHLPMFLIITLMRFTFDKLQQRRAKVLDEVDISDELHVHETDGDETHEHTYSLRAVIVHSGDSADSGHYYCYSRLPQDGAREQWMLFNDSHVTSASLDDIRRLSGTFRRDTAYVLVYRDLASVTSSVTSSPVVDVALRNEIDADNEQFVKEREDWLKNSESTSSSSNVIGWRRDDNDPPPPSCGGGGLFSNNSNRLVF